MFNINRNALNPVMNGLMTGVAIAQQIRNLAMQQDEASRRKQEFEDERELRGQQRQVQDISLTQRLLDAGRPVHGDAVLGDAVDSEMESGVPGSAAAPQLSVVRPVDKKRMVKYKRADGETVAVELYSDEEQKARQRKELQADEVAKTETALNRARAMIPVQVEAKTAIEDRPVSIPGVGMVPVSGLPTIQRIIQQTGLAQRDLLKFKNDNSQKAADRQNRMDVAKVRAAAPRAGSGGVQDRYEATERRRTEEAVRALDRQISEAWGEAEKLEAKRGGKGQGGAVIVGSPNAPRQVERSEELREALRLQVEGLNDKARNLTKQRNELARKLGWGESELYKVGQELIVKGKRAKVTKVYPDGSFDADEVK